MFAVLLVLEKLLVGFDVWMSQALDPLVGRVFKSVVDAFRMLMNQFQVEIYRTGEEFRNHLLLSF